MSVSSPVSTQLNISIPTPPAVVRIDAGTGVLQNVSDAYTSDGLYDGTFAKVLIDGVVHVVPFSQIGAV